MSAFIIMEVPWPMRGRADAMGGLLETGALTGPFDDRRPSKREFEALKATSAMDDELARPKFEARREIDRPK